LHLGSNSALWASTHTDVYNNSAIWASTHSDVKSNSSFWSNAKWASVYATVSSLSSKWTGVWTVMNEVSALYDLTYDYFEATASGASIGGQLGVLSAIWSSTHTDVFANSAAWASTNTDVYANSADWGQSRFKTITLSGQNVAAAIGPDVVADSVTDTLILSAGPNIALISDPTTDTITISGGEGSGSGGGSGNVYSSGWANSHGGVTVANSAELVITHNLGTTDIIVNIYGSSSSSGAGTAVLVHAADTYYDAGSYEFGAQVTEVTTTTLKINLGANGYREWGDDGTQAWTSKYLKVVAIASTSTATTVYTGAQEIAFRAHRGGFGNPQESLGTGVHVVQCTHTDFNEGSKYDTSTYKFTPGVAGRYWLKGSVRWKSTDEEDENTAMIYKNGSEIARGMDGTPHTLGAGEDYRILTVSTLVEADADDYFELRATNAMGGTTQIEGQTTMTFFEGHAIASQVVPAADAVAKYTAAWAVSHGSVTVANGSTHTITHNLGTTDVIVQMYVNSSASDTNAQYIGSSMDESAGADVIGGLVTTLTSNTIVVQLGLAGYQDWNSDGEGTETAFTSKYLKVVVIG